MPKRTPKDLSQLRQPDRAQVDEILEGASPSSEVRERPTRVVAIPLSQILPDRFQSRVILPPEIKHSFFTGEIDCFQAAQSLMVAADGDPALRRQVNELLLLGESILTDKQIEPATGSWVKTPSGPRFLLEAGERRFWALCLKSVQLELKEEPTLQVIENRESSRLRQVAENLQREDLSAVDLGKAVAALILIYVNLHPDPASQDELAYYRQALEIKRVPSGTWPTIQRIVGLSQTYLFRHLQILSLDDELLYLASLYRVEERRLREILSAPKDKQRGLMLSAVDERLSFEELELAAQKAKAASPRGASRRVSSTIHRKIAGRARALIKFMQMPEFDRGYDRVARELSALIRNPKDLEAAARGFENLAASLRKIRSQRSA